MDFIGTERLPVFSELYVTRNSSRHDVLWPAFAGGAAGVALLWVPFIPTRLSISQIRFELEFHSYGVTTGIAVMVLVGSLALLAPALLEGVAQAPDCVFERDALAWTVQMASLFLFIAGFHLDMLAS
jgi:hypothetical protein